MRFLAACAVVALLGACGGETEEPKEPAACSGSGKACVWAGVTDDFGFNGDGLDRRKTLFYWVFDLEFSPSGVPFILDWNNHRVRRVDEGGKVHTLVGSDFVGDGPELAFGEPNPENSPAGAPGDTVLLNHPTDLLFLPDGRLLLDAWHNHKLRVVDVNTDNVRIMCGAGAGYKGDGGPATKAIFNQPKGIALGPSGEIYVLDQRNQRIRRIAAGTDPIIENVVGSGTKGFNGDGNTLAETQLSFHTGGNPEPSGGMVLTADGKVLYVSDTENQRIRKVYLEDDRIETIAGTGTAGFSGDGGPATAAQVSSPRDLELSADEKQLFIADTDNNRIRRIDLGTGVITTVVGDGTNGPKANAPALEVQLNRPMGLAVRPDGTLYVADTFNSRVLEVQP